MRGHRSPGPVVGITLIIPEGVVMEDHDTGERVVRTRTERYRSLSMSIMCPVPAG